MADPSRSGQGSRSTGEISEPRPERQEATSQGKIRGRNLGRGNDKCKAPEAGRNSKQAIVAGPDEREVIEAAKIQDTKALVGVEVSLDFILCG